LSSNLNQDFFTSLGEEFFLPALYSSPNLLLSVLKGRFFVFSLPTQANPSNFPH